MDDQLKSNLTSSEHWTRFIYMVLFAIFMYIATIVAGITVVAQFLFALITGAPNRRLQKFGCEITAYINQVWLFLTYNSEAKAYPFADWPTAADLSGAEPGETADEPVTSPPVKPVHSEQPEANTTATASSSATSSEEPSETVKSTVADTNKQSSAATPPVSTSPAKPEVEPPAQKATNTAEEPIDAAKTDEKKRNTEKLDG